MNINPLAAKLIIYMLPFPVTEGVLPFMESHLTLCSLHKGQTSQDNFAGAAAALQALTDICESHSWCQGRPEVENAWAKLPAISSSNRKAEQFSLKFGTRDGSSPAGSFLVEQGAIFPSEAFPATNESH